ACILSCLVFFFQAEDGIRDFHVTGVQTCALPILIDNQKFDRDDIFRENELRNTANILSSVSGGYFKEYKTQNWLYALDVEAGLVVNFRDMHRNIPYLEATNSFEYNLPSKRNVTLATVLGGKAMFNPRFEFYQAATIGGETGLRGFRNERFAGQHY